MLNATCSIMITQVTNVTGQILFCSGASKDGVKVFFYSNQSGADTFFKCKMVLLQPRGTISFVWSLTAISSSSAQLLDIHSGLGHL